MTEELKTKLIDFSGDDFAEALVPLFWAMVSNDIKSLDIAENERTKGAEKKYLLKMVDTGMDSMRVELVERGEEV